MRIAVDLTALADNFTGIERYALNIALELLRQNTQDTFELLFKGAVYPDFQIWTGRPEVHFHVLKPCSKLLFNQLRLPAYLNRLKADCCLFLAFPMPVFLRGKHIYGTIHDMGCWDCPETMKRQMVWYFRLSYRWMARRAERIITISEFSKDRIRAILRVPEEKMIVAYCGLSENFRTYERAEVKKDQNKTDGTGDPKKKAKGEDCTEEAKTVMIREKYHLPGQYYLCLSTLEPRKNMQLLLNEYLKLRREGRIHTPLVLAGRKGWKIDKLLEKAGTAESGQVSVTGFIEDKDLPVIYRMAKCFVFPSIYEGFGIPPLEAMSQGVPVLAADSSSIPEILGDAAIYFRSNDAADLRRALLQIEQKNTVDLKRRIEKGMRRSREFSYEKEAGKLMQDLHKCRKGNFAEIG